MYGAQMIMNFPPILDSDFDDILGSYIHELGVDGAKVGSGIGNNFAEPLIPDSLVCLVEQANNVPPLGATNPVLNLSQPCILHQLRLYQHVRGV